MDTEQRIRERKERLARAHRLGKRAPDSETITVTDMNTADYKTSTSTVTAAMTNTVEVDVTITAMTTQPPATVYSGVSTIATRTTLVPRTVTRMKKTITMTTKTHTVTKRRVSV